MMTKCSCKYRVFVNDLLSKNNLYHGYKPDLRQIHGPVFASVQFFEDETIVACQLFHIFRLFYGP